MAKRYRLRIGPFRVGSADVQGRAVVEALTAELVSRLSVSMLVEPHAHAGSGEDVSQLYDLTLTGDVAEELGAIRLDGTLTILTPELSFKGIRSVPVRGRTGADLYSALVRATLGVLGELAGATQDRAQATPAALEYYQRGQR